MPARLHSSDRWTEEDDEQLRSMSQTGKSITLMTVKLKRPMARIKSRASELGIGIPGTEIGTRKRHAS